MKKVLTSLAKFPLILISLLPFPVIYALADFLYVVLYYIIGYRKHVVRENMKNSFPEKTAQELLKLEKKYFHFLADLILETIKMNSLSKADFHKRFYINNPEEVEQYLNKDQSVIMVTGHYGNWEWGALRFSFEFKNPFLIIFKPLTDKNMEQTINKARSRFGAVMVSMRNTLRTLIAYKENTFWTAFLGDQTPVPSEIHYYDTFLNQKTPIFLGTEKMAKLTNSAVVYGVLDRVKRGYYVIDFVTLTDKPKETAEYEITQAHTRMLENLINKRPELWLWSHKRWKYVQK